MLFNSYSFLNSVQNLLNFELNIEFSTPKKCQISPIQPLIFGFSRTYWGYTPPVLDEE